MNEDKQGVWKVTHVKDDVETVLLVTAIGERDARRQAMEHMYPPDNGNNWTVMYWMKIRSCSISSIPFRPDTPYRLYALNRRTGEMTP
jgi:hypothetical protein